MTGGVDVLTRKRRLVDVVVLTGGVELPGTEETLAVQPTGRPAYCPDGRGRRGRRRAGVDAAHHVRGRGSSGTLEVALGLRVVANAGLTGAALTR